jgi:hypothetical protein
MIYDLTHPVALSGVDYVHNRHFDANFAIGTDTGEGDTTSVGDLSPEGMKCIAIQFIPSNLCYPIYVIQYGPAGSALLPIGNDLSQ